MITVHGISSRDISSLSVAQCRALVQIVSFETCYVRIECTASSMKILAKPFEVA